MTELEWGQDLSSDTKCDSISRQVSRRLQLKNSRGKQSSENSSGSLKEALMNAAWLNSLTENIEQTWATNLQSGLLTQMPKVKPSVISTTSMSSISAQFMGRNGATSTVSRSTKEQIKLKPYYTNLELSWTPDESYSQHGTLTNYIKWHSLRVIHSPSFVSLTDV